MKKDVVFVLCTAWLVGLHVVLRFPTLASPSTKTAAVSRFAKESLSPSTFPPTSPALSGPIQVDACFNYSLYIPPPPRDNCGKQTHMGSTRKKGLLLCLS